MDAQAAGLLQAGDRIAVTDPAPLDPSYAGRRGRVDPPEFTLACSTLTSPHGYVRAVLDGDGHPVLLHPESLEPE